MEGVSLEINSEVSFEPVLCAFSLASGSLTKIKNTYQSEFPDAPSHLVQAEDRLLPSDCGVEAAKASLNNLSIQIKDVDLLISCTHTPDLNNPSLASTILHKLGAKGVPGLEMRQSTAGVHYAIDLATKLIKQKQKKCIIIVATEFLARYFGGYQSSERLSQAQRALRARSSDGAGALIVTSSEYLKRIGASHVQELLLDDIFVGANPAGWNTYCALLPSSSQFPLRLTQEDVLAAKHLPFIEEANFLKSSSLVLHKIIQEKFMGFLSNIEKNGEVALHAPLLAKKYENSLSLASKITDLYPEKGFIGSAGIIDLLYDYSNSNNLKGKELFLIGIGSGIQIGCAVIRAK